jgi:uncharacterized protein YfaS (alpha-2-macroglobulin family)
MKNLLRSTFVLAIIFLFLGADKSGYDLAKADRLFDKGVFQEALSEYEGVEKNLTDEEIKTKTLLRRAECLGHLFRYEEAAQLLKDAKEPSGQRDNIRLQLYKAEFFRNSLAQYGNIQPEEIIEGSEGKEAAKMTKKAALRLITDSYMKLYAAKNEMKKMPLRDEGYFIDTKRVEFDAYPSVFEFYVSVFSAFLLENSAESKEWPKASEVLKEGFNKQFSIKDPYPLAAAELLNEAYLTAPNARVKEFFLKERIMLPFRYPGYFERKDLAEDKNINDQRDYEALRLKTLELLLSFKEKFTTKQEKADSAYRAAVIYQQLSEFKKAVALLKEITEKYSDTYTALLAAQLLAGIEKPRIYLNVNNGRALPPANDALSVSTKKLKEVYFRAYSVDYAIISKKYRELFPQYSGYSFGNIQEYVSEEFIKKYVLSLTPEREWKTEIETKDEYQTVDTKIKDQKFALGLYIILASEKPGFEIGSCQVSGALFNVTDLMMISTVGFTSVAKNAYGERLEGSKINRVEDEAGRFYTVNGVTGEPSAGAAVNLDYSRSNNDRRKKNLVSDYTGVASFTEKAEVDAYGSNWINIFAHGKKGSSNAFVQAYFNWYPQTPISLFIETDRPIYRPGDTVNFKVIGVRKRKTGYSPVSEGVAIAVTARDTNYKELFKKEYKANTFGSVSGSFVVPSGRLLGQYSLNANASEMGWNGGTTNYFKVEEYKRPEYDVKMKAPEKPLQYGETAEVKGDVKYYFGGAVTGAKIKYKIKRQKYIPSYYSWWYGSVVQEEVGAGETTADDKGSFTVSFKTEPIKNSTSDPYIPDITRYTVEAGARDAGGREINGTASCFAGKSGFYGLVEFKNNFYFEKDSIVVTSKALTVNETPYACKVSFEVFLLEQEKITNAGLNYNTNIEASLREAKNGKLLKSGDAEIAKEGKIDIDIGHIEQGAYRIVFTADSDAGEKEKVKWSKCFIVARDKETALPVELFSVCLAEKEQYNPGETASLLIGASPLGGNYFCEIYTGEFLVKKFRTEGKLPVRVIEVPVTEELKGGFSVKWFGVKNLELGGASENCKVPWSEKKLKVKLDPFNSVLTPGKEQKYGVRVTDKNEQGVKAEVLAFMYDKSLEYYAKSSAMWLDSLWGQRFKEYNVQGGIYLSSNTYAVTEGIWEKMLRKFEKKVKPPKTPSIRTSGKTWNRSMRRNAYSDGMKLKEAAAGEALMVACSKVGSSLDESASPVGMLEAKQEAGKKNYDAAVDKQMDLPGEKRAGQSAAIKAVEARKAFADTAFFLPYVMTNKDGRGEFSFKAPEQLTSWAVKIFSFTEGMQEGVLSEEAVTKKDLMIRVDLPRFFREKDKGTIQAIVSNESDRELRGEMNISITEDGKPAEEKVKLSDTVKKFTVKSKGLVSFDWKLDIPEGVTEYNFKVVAVSGELSDAEERSIPILPSRERLIETSLIALSGTETGTLEIKLKNDPTRINEYMQVQVEPQLMLSVLNALPFLVDYPYECVEQTLNKFVPLAITNAIYEKYPEVKAAVHKLPKREGRTAPWEKEDPKRLVKLMETPWLWESEGRKYCWPVIDMFDPETVSKLTEQKLDKLQRFQLPSGGFPWFDGGKEDFYMTLLVLDGFAEARKYDVKIPADMINRAIGYVNREIPKYLKKAEESELTLAVYAAYVVTSYSKAEYGAATKSHEGARAWVKLIDESIFKLTPFGKGYLASIYFRLGEEKRANEVLDIALDGSKEDKIAGVYWTPERYSWVWYSDTVEKHAFFLKMLTDFRPEDKRIKGMVQWLLFNKKGNNWKSTKASAAAIYSILNYMSKTGALATGETFEIRWGKTVESVTLKGDEFLEKPIRFEKKGFEITAKDDKAEIKKEGKGFAFASMTKIYSTDQIPEASTPGMVNLDRKFYLRVKEGTEYHLKPLASEDKVKVGDEIEVYLKINTKSRFEYMHLKDPKPAGFEAVSLLSGWKYEKLFFYEEQRDSLTNFFISRLPHGEFVLRYKLKPTKAGTFRVGAATLQSMYAPDMTGHSSGFIINVE